MRDASGSRITVGEKKGEDFGGVSLWKTLFRRQKQVEGEHNSEN